MRSKEEIFLPEVHKQDLLRNDEPLVGDHLYGGINPTLLPRQALHAYKLSFRHPVTGEPMTLEAPLPEDMELVIKKIRGVSHHMGSDIPGV